MTPEVRRAGKEDVWTEQEYFAACLESKKRRLGLRSSIPQDEEEAAGALPEMSDYTMEVDKWYIHSDNPKLIGALTGRYGAEERVRAKEAVFRKLLSRKVETEDLVLDFCRIDYGRELKSQITEWITSRVLSEIEENLLILAKFEARKGRRIAAWALRGVLFSATTELALSYLEGKNGYEQDEASFKGIVCELLKQHEWSEYECLFCFIGHEERSASSLFFPYAKEDKEGNFWPLKMIPALKYLRKILVGAGYVGEAYRLCQNQKASFIANGICTDDVSDAWSEIWERSKSGWLNPLEKIGREGDGETKTLAENVIEKGIAYFASTVFKQQGEIKDKLLSTEINGHIEKLFHQDPVSAQTVADGVRRFRSEVERWINGELIIKEHVLRFALAGLDMFLAFSTKSTSSQTKDYLLEVAAILQEGADLVVEEVQKANARKWERTKLLCGQILGGVFTDMVAKLIEVAQIYDTAEKIGDMEIYKGPIA